MRYLRGADRSQTQLLPPSVEDYVGADAPVRFIDAFVEELNFVELGFERAQPAATGRPGYHPADLLKLFLYGYLHRIRSSRRLEAEAGRNLELIWLLRQVRPDFKTIADFRKDNRHVFKPVFKQFNLLCRKLDLFGAELVAIDGSKFKASNNPHRHFSQKQLEGLIKTIEERIDNYLKELDQQDEETQGVSGRPSAESLQEKIAKLKERRGCYDQLLGELKEAGVSEVSLVDQDSRAMPKVEVGYNVQVAVDAKHHLIVEPEVVQVACDRGQLSQMAGQAKESLAVEQLKVVADAGYHEADQLEGCEKQAIQTYVPESGTSSGKSRDGKQVYPKERFIYDATQDLYRCPAGKKLAAGRISRCRGKDRITYSNRAACRSCPFKQRCTTAGYRAVYRRTNEAVVDRQRTRLAAHPEMMLVRKSVVEHVFGTLRLWGHDHFLMRGLAKVRAEFSLSSLAYNLRRVLNLKGVDQLIAGLSKMTVKSQIAA